MLYCSSWALVSESVSNWSTLNSLRVSVWLKFDWGVAVTSTLFHNHVMFLGARLSESFLHHWNTETGTNQNHGSEPRVVSDVKIRVFIKEVASGYWRKQSSYTLAARWPSQWVDCFKLFVFVWHRAAGLDHSWADSQLQAALTSVHFHLHLPTICQPHVCDPTRRLEAQNRPPAVILC